MAQITDGNGDAAVHTKRRRRKARGRQVTTSRSGAGAGMGARERPATVHQGGLANLTAEQAYQLGIQVHNLDRIPTATIHARLVFR